MQLPVLPGKIQISFFWNYLYFRLHIFIGLLVEFMDVELADVES